jgi:hypothetical protein
MTKNDHDEEVVRRADETALGRDDGGFCPGSRR